MRSFILLWKRNKIYYEKGELFAFFCGVGMEISAEEKTYLLTVAKRVLAFCVGEGKSLSEVTFPNPPDSKMAEPCGAFVTYHLCRNGKKELRGCIGLMEGLYPLWETVARMAYSAAFHDTRFMPVSKEELPFIECEITVLTPFRPCADISEIELGRHGIMFECRGHRAVFLPQVPLEQGWNKEQTLEFLAMKAGLSARAWQDREAKFSVFEGLVLQE